VKVIGTAGHIDHGKSTLVHRLTGIDPDRLSEEKQRGMTIDLGFAWLTLPSGAEVSIVDVPGHERFVKNMLAGAGGIDVALLVVAADEAVMPQTREHLDILDLLGVQHGVVALTKADLVEADWLELAASEVLDALDGTTLAGSPIVPVSALTGAGIPQLLQELDATVKASPEREDRGLPFLPVDRVFTVAGYGTVVTGTLHGGSMAVGREVEVVPGGRRGRVRSMQSHRQQVDAAGPGARVAVNVVGLARDEVDRGDVLALPATVPAVPRLAARVRVLPSAPFPLRHGLAVSVHIGAAERTATLTLIGQKEGDGKIAALEPGQTGWAQLRFAEPVPAVRGQRFILRLPAPARTVAGGQVVDVAPRLRRSDPSARERLRGLNAASLEEAVMASLLSSRARTAAQISVGVGASQERIAVVLRDLEVSGDVVHLGDVYLGRQGWDSLVRTVVSALESYHASFPLRRGMPKEELRSKLRLGQGFWAASLKRLSEESVLREQGSLVALPAHAGGTMSRRPEVDRVLEVLGKEPFSPPGERELLQMTGTDRDVLSAMAEEGAIVRIDDGLYLSREAYEQMIARVLATIRAEGEVTVARIRDVLGTTRKYALAFLEHLDSRRMTRRVGDARVLGSKAACA